MCYCEPDEKTLADLLAGEDGDPYEPLTRDQRHAVAARYIAEIQAWAEAPLPEPRPMTEWQRQSRAIMRQLSQSMIKQILERPNWIADAFTKDAVQVDGKTFEAKIQQGNNSVTSP